MSRTYELESRLEAAPVCAGGRRVFYGWLMLPIAMAGIIATSPGQTFGISAFNTSLREALGLSHSQLTGAYMLGTLLASLPMAYVGALSDRYGVRRIMTVVVILFGLVCIAASQAAGLVTLFLAFLGLRMLGQGALGLLAGNTLAYWFDRRLGTVAGFMHFGMAGALAAVPAINLWLIAQFGWRWAWVILGVAVLGLMLPLMVLFRNRPEDVGQRKDGLPPGGPADEAILPALEFHLTLQQAMRTRAFWIAGAALALWSMMNTGVLFNLLPIFETRGLSGSDAATLFTTFAVSLAAMHLIGGYLADRLPLNVLLAAAMVFMAVAMGLVGSISDLRGIILTGTAMGIGQALLVSVGSQLWPRYYGREHLGRIRGTMATVMVASSSLGPFLVGVTRDLSGGYGPILLAFVLLPIPLCVLGLLATPPQTQGRFAGDPSIATIAEEN